ncbi:unnamed protein product [Brassica rapa subsp. narinosa]
MSKPWSQLSINCIFCFNRHLSLLFWVIPKSFLKHENRKRSSVEN